MQNIIDLKNVTYNIKDGDINRPILDNITYSFEKNKSTSVSGSSGSGKTTLLYAVSGLLKNIDSGNININGRSIYDMKLKSRDKYRLNNISLVFQNLNLFSFMNVKQNICVPLYAKNKLITKEVNEKISYYLNVLGLEQIQEKQYKTLSGGEQQRIAIIRAIIDNPSVILCDEPTASLDEKNSIMFLEQLNKVISNEKLTAIVVSHDPIVKQYCDINIIMNDGKILGD